MNEAEKKPIGKTQTYTWIVLAILLSLAGLFFVSLLLLKHWPHECAEHISWDEEDVNI